MRVCLFFRTWRVEDHLGRRERSFVQLVHAVLLARACGRHVLVAAPHLRAAGTGRYVCVLCVLCVCVCVCTVCV